MIKLKNYIGGEFLDPVGDGWIENFEPATGKVYSYLPDSSDADVDHAVRAALEAFPAWSSTSASERARVLNRIADLIEENLESLARAESRDQGKPYSLAKAMDVPRAASNFRFFAGAILHQEERATDMDGAALNYALRVPVGVAGLISPWNLPLYLMTWKIAPAIATGNTCVVKGSELTPMSAFLLSDILSQAGLPAGVVNIVHGYGHSVGRAITSHPKIPIISFTGGTETGKDVQIQAAEHCKKLSLELGGKNPNLIFADAPFEECVTTSVRSSFTNQGEICLCGSRIFVQKPLYEEFLAAFIEKTRQLRVGDPLQDDTDLGALVSSDHLKKVQSYVELSKGEGGEIVTGSDCPKLPESLSGGFFMNPCVITGVPTDGRVMQEEIFGPVVTVTPFSTEEEGLAMANSVRFGLASSLWTSDLRRAHRVARRIEAGITWVNSWMLRDLRTPFGGMKASGSGREGGNYSLDFYSETKNICVKISS